MNGSLDFWHDKLETAISDWKSWLSGNKLAIKSQHDQQSDLECEDLKQDVEAWKESALKGDRAEFHFDASKYRDMRHAVQGSQFGLRLAAWNRMRDLQETARATYPLKEI